jgi:hypothetical protein
MTRSSASYGARACSFTLIAMATRVWVRPAICCACYGRAGALHGLTGALGGGPGPSAQALLAIGVMGLLRYRCN